MSEVLCFLDLSQGMFDDEITIYSDGRVYRKYDKNYHNYNIKRWYEKSQINGTLRQRILDACKSDDIREKLVLLFPG